MKAALTAISKNWCDEFDKAKSVWLSVLEFIDVQYNSIASTQRKRLCDR